MWLEMERYQKLNSFGMGLKLQLLESFLISNTIPAPVS